MKEENLQAIPSEDGLVAFFDILGFKKMLSANEVEKSLEIINAYLLKELADNEKTYRSKLKTFVISDSILIALPNLTREGAMYFTMFCQQFIWGLLMNGLPIRGAIASGKFSVQANGNHIIFVGQPIVDANELVNSLEIAACVLTPSAEFLVSEQMNKGKFQIHDAPIKNSPARKLYLLKYGTSCSREQMIYYFEKHNKYLDSDSSKIKLNNTIEFLNECGQLKPD